MLGDAGNKQGFHNYIYCHVMQQIQKGLPRTCACHLESSVSCGLFCATANVSLHITVLGIVIFFFISIKTSLASPFGFLQKYSSGSTRVSSLHDPVIYTNSKGLKHRHKSLETWGKWEVWEYPAGDHISWADGTALKHCRELQAPAEFISLLAPALWASFLMVVSAQEHQQCFIES